MKDSGLRVRVDTELRNQFIRACKANDTTAAQVLRAYMRQYVEEHFNAAQGDFFVRVQKS